MRVVNKDVIRKLPVSTFPKTIPQRPMIFGEIYRYGSEWKFKAVRVLPAAESVGNRLWSERRLTGTLVEQIAGVSESYQ